MRGYFLPVHLSIHPLVRLSIRCPRCSAVAIKMLDFLIKPWYILLTLCECQLLHKFWHSMEVAGQKVNGRWKLEFPICRKACFPLLPPDLLPFDRHPVFIYYSQRAGGQCKTGSDSNAMEGNELNGCFWPRLVSQGGKRPNMHSRLSMHCNLG